MNFSNRDAAAIAIQVLGLNLVLRYFQYIGMSLTRQMPLTAATLFTTTLGLLVFGLVLLFTARRLAIFIVRRKRAFAVPPDIAVVDLQAIAFSVLGVYTVIIGVGQLLAALQLQSEFQQLPRPFQWPSVVQIALGIALFVAGKRLASAWWRINNQTESQPDIGQVSSEGAPSDEPSVPM